MSLFVTQIPITKKHSCKTTPPTAHSAEHMYFDASWERIICMEKMIPTGEVKTEKGRFMYQHLLGFHSKFYSEYK